MELLDAVYNNDSVKLASLLQDGGNPDMIIPEDWMTLHRQDISSYWKYYLLLKQSEGTSVRDLKWTLLHWASMSGNYNIVEILLEYGANHNDKNGLGETALHIAVKFGHTHIVGILLDFGANPNTTTLASDTPVHIAVKENNIEILKVLLTHNANASAKDKVWVTPLHIAAEDGNYQAVKLLLNYGANPYIIDDLQGQTPLDWVLDISNPSSNHLEIIKLLQNVAKE